MPSKWLTFVAAASTLTLAATALTVTSKGAARVGDPAPGWTLTDTVGKTHSLVGYAGKFVVLEWTNAECPFVQKHYGSGNMQKTQQFARDHGAVWLSVISSSPGSAGYVTPAQGQQIMLAEHSKANAKLLDPDGKVGRAYGARSTPDIMIIDPKGTLIYSGAIDDKPTAEVEDLKGAHNYVIAALTEAMAGKPVTTPTSQPYGCGIHYSR